MEKVYFIIPAYNEEENIMELVREWHSLIMKIDADSRLVIVNDGSKDRTLEILRSIKGDFPHLIILDKPNSGHGGTIHYGYKFSLEQGADFIFQTDSDRQTLPEEFWPFWEKRKCFSIITGIRNQRKDGLSRIFVTRVLRLIILLVFGKNIPDANTPFRLFHRDILEQALKIIPDSHNLTNVMLSIVLATKNVKVCWLPINFRPRQGGVNSINLPRIAGIGFKAIKDFLDFKAQLNGRKL